MSLLLSKMLLMGLSGRSGPSLNFNFVDGSAFSPQITFTRASSATYFDATGTLQSAAIDVPRFDYDPATLAARGLLIEEQRTNNVLRSQDFSTGWIVSNSNLTAASGIAPDGTNTAGKLALNSGIPVASTRAAYQEIAGITGVQTISIFSKAVEFNVLRISARAADNTTLVGPDFTLSGAGSFGALGNATSASITSVGNGWYRCVATFDLLTGATAVRPYYASSQATGDGTSGILIWGAQVEAGAFPTSYIPTTTTALTRSADVASVNTLSPWYNAAEGTLYSEATFTNTVSFNTTAGFTDGTSANTMRTLQWNDGTDRIFSVVTSGTPQATFSTSTAQIGTAKFAGAYKLNDMNASKNGSIATTDISATVPTVTTLWLGITGPASFLLNGWLRRITYYPRRLSNAELQALTA